MPPRYNVVMLNDEYTPMDFVVSLLRSHFEKAHAEAFELMMQVHRNGTAIAGVYTHEVAEQKVLQAMAVARSKDHPFQLRCERA